MPSCVIHGCVASWKKHDPSIILHAFPREPEKIKLWLQQTGQYRSSIDKMVKKVYLGKIYDTYRMCSLHFTHDCYIYDGYRRTLRKDAIPTIFKKKTKKVRSVSLVSTIIPSLSGSSSSSSEQHISTAPPADSQMPSCSGTVRTYQVKFPVIYPKTSSQPNVQKMNLVPLVPQRVSFQTCKISQKSDSVIDDRSSSITVQPTATIISEATQKQSVLSNVSEQSSLLRPSTSSILEVPALSSLCIQQSKSTVSTFTASSNSKHLEQLTPVNLQQNTLAPVTFLQKPLSSVFTSSNLPLGTQLGPEGSSLSTITPSSTTSFCPIISLHPESSPVISTSEIDKSPYKTPTVQPSSVPLTIVSKKKPCSVTFLPVSGNVPSVRQMPATTSSSANKLPLLLKKPTVQMVFPNCLPPSKKRKLEENTVSLEPSAASPSGPSVLPSHSTSQTSVNSSKLYLVLSTTPLVQPSGLIKKPVMVDKGVNTDFFTNRKSCCVATDPMHRKRTTGTQTKIYTKHRKIMCTLLVPREETDDSNPSITMDSLEDTEMNDCSLSSSSDGGSVLCEDLDIPVPASSYEKEFHIKEENDSYLGEAGQSIVKSKDNPFPISRCSQDVNHLVSQNPKLERTSPIPCEPFAPVYRNPTSWETSAIQTDHEPEYSNDSSFHIDELSEDEDETFLVPSDAEDEDDIKHVFQEIDSSVENLVEEGKYIVFESCLKKLIMMIPCRSETKCMSPLTHYRKETIGSYLSVEVRCSSGHTSLLWESQPRHGYEPLGNVLLSAAVLFSGSSFVKSQHMFKLLNLKSVDKTTYSKHQCEYLFPTINHHWKEEQKAVIQSVQERRLCLAGDQQLDNSRFSAKYSTYSLMDVASKKIFSFSVEPVTPQVTVEDLEKIGFLKAMEELQTMKANVKMIVTDRSVGVQEILKDSYPGIVHQLDLWHLSKSIGNEVLLAARHKDCEILHQWVEAVRKHLWWSSCTCCKNPDLLTQKWKSVVHHVANIHEWDGGGDCKGCHHPPLPEEVVNSTNWLVKDSAAYEQLKQIVENSSLLKDLKQLSFISHTGELEIYHRTCLKYHPKTLHFFIDSMVARTQLAALDHNRNVDMVKAVVNNASSGDALDSMTQRVEVSKGQKSWIMKALYKPSCQNFLFDIMIDVIALVKEEKTF